MYWGSLVAGDALKALVSEYLAQDKVLLLAILFRKVFPFQFINVKFFF